MRKMLSKEEKQARSAKNKAEFKKKKEAIWKDIKEKKQSKLAAVSIVLPAAKGYSKELGQIIADLLEKGLSLRDVAKINGMPSPGAIVQWTKEHAEFEEMYLKAKKIAVDNEFEEIKEIADKEPAQIYDAQGNKIYDKSELDWRRQRIEARRFRVAKLAPEKYGDKLELSGNKENPLQHAVSINIVPISAK